MILLTGGTSFNAKEFVHDYVGEIIILQHLNKKRIDKSDIFYLGGLKELKNFDNKKDIKTIINFASSINIKNNFFSNFSSSLYMLLRIYIFLKKFNPELVVNIGSMWQDVPKMRFKSYVFVKNLTDFIFIRLFKNVKYITIKLGDTYGVNDKRNKLVKILKSQLSSNELTLKGKKENLVFPIHTKSLSLIIRHLLTNRALFLNSNINYVRAYIEPYSLYEFTNIFSRANNFDKKITFGENKGILTKDLKPENDFCFLINENLYESLKDI